MKEDSPINALAVVNSILISGRGDGIITL